MSTTKVALLISAPAGFGKTSFCKWHFLHDVQLLTESKSNTIPVYVPLHQLATAPVTTIEDVFLRSDDVRHLVNFAKQESRPIRLYLDGLDEVSTTEQQRKLMELASHLPQELPTSQVIVTARDYVTGHWLRWLARINLAELTEKQVDQFILNWLGENQEELKRFREELDKARTLMSLMHVPLLGTLIIAVFKKMQSLPENKVKLYEIFVDLMCGGWDIAKNVRRTTKFGSNAKLSILTRLAGRLHLNERREAEEVDITSVVRECFPALYDSWRTVLGELLEDGLLVRLAGGLGFAHLSFQPQRSPKTGH